MKIRVDLYGSGLAGDNRHAQEMMKDYGIEYENAEAVPIADCWIFSGVTPESVPDNLPNYIEVICT